MNIKKIIIFLIILISIISISTISNASFLGNFTGNLDGESAVRTGKILHSVLEAIQVIGVTVAVVMLIVLGMKYMLSSASERAEIKKHAVIYIIGAVILFGASGIAKIIKTFAANSI